MRHCRSDGVRLDGFLHSTARVDKRADARIRRASQRYAILDAAKYQQLQVLVFFLVVKPAIVAEVGEEVGALATGCGSADQTAGHRWVHVFQANWRDKPGLTLN